MINATCDPAKDALPRWVALASNALPQTPSEPPPRSTNPCVAARRSDAAKLECPPRDPPRQPGEDHEAKATGPALIRLLAYCILLSALAAAFATAFAMAPYWLPRVVSMWWAF